MNIFNFGGGDKDSNNDYIRMYIAMDAGQNSLIKIYNQSGKGAIEYRTNSDYIWKLERRKFVSNTLVPLSQSESDKTGYPGSLAWIPGNSISSLSNSTLLEGFNIKSLTPKNQIDSNKFIKSQSIILEDYYDDPWAFDGKIQVINVTAITNDPFIEIRREEITNTALIDIKSSSIEGCIFSIDIKRNFLEGSFLKPGSLLLPERIEPVINESNKKDRTLQEWNSLFSINDNSNADSIFRSGENRDEVFTEELKKYLDENWNDKLKKNLWGDAITNQNIELSTRDPKKLKDHIYYCFYYFGLSEDILNIGKFYFQDNESGVPNASTLIRWHIGLGAKSKHSNQERYIINEESSLPVIGQTKVVRKVSGLPPKTSYVYNFENNSRSSFASATEEPENTLYIQSDEILTTESGDYIRGD